MISILADLIDFAEIMHIWAGDAAELFFVLTP